MKKLLALLLMVMILSSSAALAESIDFSKYTDEELNLAFDNIQIERATRGFSTLPDLTAYTDEELIALHDAITAEQDARGIAAEVKILQKGSKGDDVKALQQRLIELNYLSGSADGDYGNKTKSAVELFQKDAAIPVTGIADAETQDILYSEYAPVAKVYLNLDFKAISRDPDSYNGKNYTFTGKVIQVMEEEMESYTYVAMRIATKNNYDDVVYVSYLRENNESRILEDDRVTIYATCLGLYTYETVIGGSVTLPNFFAESVTVN